MCNITFLGVCSFVKKMKRFDLTRQKNMIPIILIRPLVSVKRREAVISFPEQQQASSTNFIDGYSLEGLQVWISTTCHKHTEKE